MSLSKIPKTGLENPNVNTTDIVDGAVVLTSKVSGILPIANGGTGQNSGAIVFQDLSQTLTQKVLHSANNTLEATSAPDGTSFGFRNRIIGGNFTTNPWQRGTIFTGANGYTADRFIISPGTSSAVFNVQKTQDNPTFTAYGPSQNCLHASLTTADTSIAAGDWALISHTIEGYNVADFGFGQSGTRYFTLSFDVKSTKTGIFCIAFRNGPTINRTYIAEYTVNTTNTWEHKTITVPVDVTGTWNQANDVGLIVTWTLASGSTYQTTANSWQAGNFLSTANQVNALDSTSNNFKLSNIQLELGTKETPFEFRSVGTELDLCERYCQTIDHGVGDYVSVTTVRIQSHLRKALRSITNLTSTPQGALSLYKPSNGTTSIQSSANLTFLNTISSNKVLSFEMINFSGLTSGQFWLHGSSNKIVVSADF